MAHRQARTARAAARTTGNFMSLFRQVLSVISTVIAALVAHASESPSLQARLDAAIRAGQREIALPAGVLRLDAGLRVINATNLTINGLQTTLVFANQKGFGFTFHNCRDVALRGVTMDFDPLPFTQGTITKMADDRSWCEFAVHDGYPSLSENYLVKHVHIFERDRTRWKTEAPDVYARKVTALDPRHGRIEAPPTRDYFDHVAVGDRLVLNKRDGGAVSVRQCENFRVEGVTILGGPGGGVICRYMRGDNRFSFDIRPGPPPAGAKEPRLMSTCADGFNYAYARRGPVVENCHFSFMGDDSVNLHGFTFLVTEVVSPTELLVGWPYTRESVEWTIEPDDAARLLRAGNYAIAGQAAIESFRHEPKPGEDLVAKLKAFWPRTQTAKPAIFRVKLREALPATVGDAIDIPATSAPDWRISGCEFRDHRARGLRIMSPRGVIENNRLLRLKHAAISLGPEYVFWREAGWVEDVTVRGNHIEDCGLTPDMFKPTSATLGAISIIGRKEDMKSPQPFYNGTRRIVIERNTISGCALAGIWARCARELTVRDNIIRNVNLRNVPEAGRDLGHDVRGPIDVRGVAEATQTGNRIEPLARPNSR